MGTKLRISDVRFHERTFPFRLPFRFGVITLTEEAEVFVRVEIELEDRRRATGISAEALAPKWFDKNPDLTNADNEQQLRRSLHIAAETYLLDQDFETPFSLFAKWDEFQSKTCASQGLNRLIAGFGPALLDRAILDAVCRIHQISFYEAVRNNLIGLHATPSLPELSSFDFDGFLDGLDPARSIQARHTVGLVDPITTLDQDPADRIGDGLPETLEDVIATYGNSYFKLKLSGNIAADLDRLTSIAAVLDASPSPYSVTLDGNEQYAAAAEVEELWRKMEETPALDRLVQSVLLIEQPIRRQAAFEIDVSSLSERRPVIIDESDEDLDAFPKAIRFGYRGVSSKQCKGFYRSLLNAARCRFWNQQKNEAYFLMSGEDLTTQSGVAVQQDLVLANLIGLTHLERNGHHYARGMAGFEPETQRLFLESHPDLYVQDGDLVRLRIEGGELQIGSLACPGYGVARIPDLDKIGKGRRF
jgi:hypothetical protein